MRLMESARVPSRSKRITGQRGVMVASVPSARSRPHHGCASLAAPARASWWRRGIIVFGDGEGPSMRAWTLYGMAVVVRIATLMWAVHQLPDKVATHFGPSGAGDGRATRAGYSACDVVSSAALVLGLPMLVTVILAGSGVG